MEYFLRITIGYTMFFIVLGILIYAFYKVVKDHFADLDRID